MHMSSPLGEGRRICATLSEIKCETTVYEKGPRHGENLGSKAGTERLTCVIYTHINRLLLLVRKTCINTWCAMAGAAASIVVPAHILSNKGCGRIWRHFTATEVAHLMVIKYLRDLKIQRHVRDTCICGNVNDMV